MDQDTHDVHVGKEQIELSPTEFKLLRYLMLNPNRVLSKAQILDHVWEYDFNGDVGIVESYISYLRRKIDPHTEESVIQTKRGFGYMLKVGKSACTRHRHRTTPHPEDRMAHKPDAVTRWWRRISLRAKVTGVTVAVLALGLLVAGIGTVPLLRDPHWSPTSTRSCLPLVSSDLANRYLEVTSVDGTTVYTPQRRAAAGLLRRDLRRRGQRSSPRPGARTASPPVFPTDVLAARVRRRTRTRRFDICERTTAELPRGRRRRARLRARRCGSRSWRLPLAAADRMIGQYFGIYITIAFITIFIAALADPRAGDPDLPHASARSSRRRWRSRPATSASASPTSSRRPRSGA